MAEASNQTGIFYQNLEDAGCDKQTKEKCMALFQSGNLRGILPLLSNYRKDLLSTVRSGQKRSTVSTISFTKFKKKRHRRISQ